MKFYKQVNLQNLATNINITILYTNINMTSFITYGYAKDLLACFMFILFIIVIVRYKVNYNTQFILFILFLSLCLDGLFSVFPQLHNTPIKGEHFNISKPLFDRPLLKTMYRHEFLPLFLIIVITLLLFFCSLLLGCVFGYGKKCEILSIIK